MSETTMPVAEAKAATSEDERNSYEFAFHVLPTVTEGEVTSVFDALKERITKAGGELITEEAPERVDLAYEIVKAIDGKNRKFGSAHFGWVRFKLAGEKIAELTAEIDSEKQLLRYLITKLTRIEEENPFKYHENRKSVKMVEVVKEDSEAVSEAPKETEEETAEVSEKELDESLEKLTADEDITSKEEAEEEKA